MAKWIKLTLAEDGKEFGVEKVGIDVISGYPNKPTKVFTENDESVLVSESVDDIVDMLNDEN